MTTYADATDKTVDTWKQGAKAMSERMEFLVTLPSLDFVQPVERYFDYLQRAVDLNRELLIRWAEMAGQMSGTLRDEALKAGHAVEEQVEDAADKAGELALKGKGMADKVVDEAGQVVDEAENTVEDLAEDTVDTAGKATDETTDTAEDLADDAADTAKKATSSTRSRRRIS
jgi:methyl-accepting chemotaxis protein